MKSLKKTLVLLVVFSMILSAVMPAFAATDVAGLDCEEEVARLEALEVVSGYEDGTFGPEKTITRAEMAVILCKMVGIDTVTVEENKNVPSKFSDVAAGEWYTGHINVAAGKGLLSGFPDGTFRPSEQLTMNQVLTLAVNALGRGEYVAEMGTWPANYIAEATKLGLLDGVKTSDANRGNVAIIVWNTIEAPAVWDVMGTEFSDGSINLQNSNRSLLSIYFRDFATEAGELKELAEIKVDGTTNKVDDRQLVVSVADETFDDFIEEVKHFDFSKKEKDDRTYATNSDVYIYVPEEVMADLDEVEGKTVTVILGEDNVAVAVIIEDDIEDTDFLTAYDSKKDRIAVGEEKYDLAESYKVFVNDGTTEYTNIEDALIVAGVTKDFDEITKKIEATVTVEDDEATVVELLVSKTIPGVSYEALVTEVKETKSTYKIITTEGTISWDLEEEEEEDIEFPKVYIDGVRSEMRDITAGNIITVLTSDNGLSDVELMDKVYVSTKSVEAKGEDLSIRKSNYAVKVDGTYYAPTGTTAGSSNKDLEDVKSLATIASNENNILGITDCEDVTLYLNMFGEYVAVLTSEPANEYTFGVVTYVSDNTNWEGEQEEILTRNIKVLLADGNKVTYKLKVDVDNDDTKAYEKFVSFKDVTTPLEKGEFIAFEADSDNAIIFEDGLELVRIANTAALTDMANETIAADKVDFVVETAETNATKLEDAEFITTSSQNKEYVSSTVIFNNYKLGSDYNIEIVEKWDSIVDDDSFVYNKTIAVFEDAEEDEALYLVVALADYTADDAVYAVVEESAKKYGKDWFVKFGDEEDKTELATNAVEQLADVDGAFVAYEMNGSKVSNAAMLIDLAKFNELFDDSALTNGIINTVDNSIKAKHMVKGTPKYTETMHIDVVNKLCAGVTNWGKEIPGYAELKLDDFLADKADTIDLVVENDSLEAYGEEFWNATEKKYIKDFTTTGVNADPDMYLLVKADGKVHEIKMDLEYEKDAETVKESYTIYVSARIDSNATDATTISFLEKANLVVAEVGEKESKKDYRKIEYVEDENDNRAVAQLDDVKVDNDAVIYIVSGNTVTEGTWDSLEGSYVIPFNTDTDDYADVLVVIE